MTMPRRTMSDNGDMNDQEETSAASDPGELVERLASVEPQEAPEIAEQLADRLARDLDATDGSGSTEQEDSS